MALALLGIRSRKRRIATMPRPIWSGTLSFGLLNVPVQLVTAERGGSDISFRMLDGRDKKPIKYKRVNADTGEEVPWEKIVKAYEYEKNHYVVIDEKDLKSAKPEAAETIDIEAFVDRDAISPMYFEKPYYLTPAKKAEKGYVLLRDVLKRTKKVGVARVVLRTRQYLALLMAEGDALILDLLRFADEIVPQEDINVPGAAKDHRVTPRELDMAEKLIESMAAEWTPEEYRDDFEDRLHKMIERRIKEHGDATVRLKDEGKSPEHAATNVVDFMALLQQSLKKKGGKGERAAAAAKDDEERESEKPKSRTRSRAAPARPRARSGGTRKRS
jgi:DNA end-binding protein Ku